MEKNKQTADPREIMEKLDRIADRITWLLWPTLAAVAAGTALGTALGQLFKIF